MEKRGDSSLSIQQTSYNPSIFHIILILTAEKALHNFIRVAVPQ